MKKIIRSSLKSISIKPFKFYLLMMFINYGFGFFISIIFLNSEYVLYSILTILIISTGLLFFGLGWFATQKIRIRMLSYRNCTHITYVFSSVFLLTAAYVFSQTTPAILADLFTSDMTTSQLRAMATKGKTGIDSIINGLFYASSYIGISFLALLFIYEKRKYRWVVFFLTLFLLVLNGQKSRFMIILLPLMILFIQHNKFKHASKLMVIGGITLFLLMFALNFLDKGSNLSHQVTIDTHTRLTQGGRDLFINQTPMTFLIHRIIWVPYITAIDWFRYIDGELTEYLMGASIPVLSNIFGLDRINLDNQVFKFQFNVSSDSLGAANSYFTFDLIANFGYLGMLILSPIFGLIFGLIWKGLPKPFNLMIFVWLFAFTSSSFQAIFLGGGMFIILAFILMKNVLQPRQLIK